MGVFAVLLVAAAAAVVVGLDDARARRRQRPPRLPVLAAAPLADDLGRQVGRRPLARWQGLSSRPFRRRSTFAGGGVVSALRHLRPGGAPGDSACSSSCAVIAVGLANFAATVFRARSPWLVARSRSAGRHGVDGAAVRPPLADRFLGLFDGFWAPYLFAAVIAVAPLVGSAAQLAYGRTDLRRAHKARRRSPLGGSLWTALAAAARSLLWAIGVGPADLTGVVPGGDGTRMPAAVVGSTSRRRARGRWYPTLFLSRDGPVRTGSRPNRTRSAQRRVFSADGRVRGPAAPRTGRRVTPSTSSTSRDRAAVFRRARDRPRRPGLVDDLSRCPRPANLVFYAHAVGASFFERPSGHLVTSPRLPPA